MNVDVNIVRVPGSLDELLRFGQDLGAFGKWLGETIAPQVKDALEVVKGSTFDHPVRVTAAKLPSDVMMKLAWLKAHRLPKMVIRQPPYVLDGGLTRIDVL